MPAIVNGARRFLRENKLDELAMFLQPYLRVRSGETSSALKLFASHAVSPDDIEFHDGSQSKGQAHVRVNADTLAPDRAGTRIVPLGIEYTSTRRIHDLRALKYDFDLAEDLVMPEATALGVLHRATMVEMFMAASESRGEAVNDPEKTAKDYVSYDEPFREVAGHAYLRHGDSVFRVPMPSVVAVGALYLVTGAWGRLHLGRERDGFESFLTVSSSGYQGFVLQHPELVTRIDCQPF